MDIYFDLEPYQIDVKMTLLKEARGVCLYETNRMILF